MVKDVTTESFKVGLNEWRYLDGYHVNERISYMVVEEGSHTLYDGTKIKA